MNGSYKGDDEIGRLMSDFHEKSPENMEYNELAAGVKHYKETEKGRETVCESVEKYAKEYGDKREKIGEARATVNTNINAVRNLIENMKLSLDQALDVLGIKGDDRAAVEEALKADREKA